MPGFPHLLRSVKRRIVSRVIFWNTVQKVITGTIHDIIDYTIYSVLKSEYIRGQNS